MQHDVAALVLARIVAFSGNIGVPVGPLAKMLPFGTRTAHKTARRDDHGLKPLTESLTSSLAASELRSVGEPARPPSGSSAKF